MAAAEIPAFFDTDDAFADEPVEHTAARLAWLTVTQRAEVHLFLGELGLDPIVLHRVMYAVRRMQQDYVETVMIGLGLEFDAERPVHPDEQTLIAALRFADNDVSLMQATRNALALEPTAEPFDLYSDMEDMCGGDPVYDEIRLLDTPDLIDGLVPPAQ